MRSSSYGSYRNSQFKPHTRTGANNERYGNYTNYHTQRYPVNFGNTGNVGDNVPPCVGWCPWEYGPLGFAPRFTLPDWRFQTFTGVVDVMTGITYTTPTN